MPLDDLLAIASPIPLPSISRAQQALEHLKYPAH